MARADSYSVRREIMNAVKELMTEKSYMDITVTNVIKKANVARASFYRNFNSINEVIDAIVDEASSEIIEEVFPILYSTDERKWREFLFNHFYRFMRRQREMPDIRFENLSVIFTRMDNRIQEKSAQFPSETMHDKYTVSAKMGLINNVTQKWMSTGAKETPEDMINYIMSFILKF